MAKSWASLMYYSNLFDSTIYSQAGYIEDAWSNANVEWTGGRYENALWYVIGALYRIADAFFKVAGYGSWGDYDYLSTEMFNRCYTAEPPELTWQAICEAWAKDDFAGRAPTIAFIDRMRQLIWDEPFSVVWAAKPEEGG